MDELTEIKTVVSEAVTNSIIHGYENDPEWCHLYCCCDRRRYVELTIRDEGIGIEDVEEAKQPLFTTKPELERSGMGFTIMENFMDEIHIDSHQGEGTIVRFKKALNKK